MSKEQLRIGQVQEYWNVSDTRILKYTIEVYHKGLKEHKLISAPEEDMIENKVQLQIKKWAEKWENVEAKRRITAEKEANLDDANTRSDEAKQSLEKIDNILIHTLSIDDTVDWDKLKKKGNFPEETPIKPTQKTKKEYPPKPDKNSNKFKPSFTFFEKIFASKKNKGY